MNAVQKGVLGLIIANIIWGLASPIFKWSLENIPPYTLAFLRFFIASILLGIFLGKKCAWNVKERKDMLLLVAYAVSGITINIIFFFLGLERTLALNAPVIASSQPILTFIFAVLFLKERIKVKKLIGMLIGGIGLLTIVLEPLFFRGIDGDLVGNIFILFAAIGGVISTIIGRTIFQKYPPLTLMFWAFLIGTISFFPLSVMEYAQNPHLFSQLDIRGISGIIYGALFSSALAYGLFAWGLSLIPASEASMFTYIDPIAGAILSYFALHEPITIPFIIGSIFIFIGIFIAQGRLHYHPFQRLKGAFGHKSKLSPFERFQLEQEQKSPVFPFGKK